MNVPASSDRRTLVKTAGAAAIGLVAGCTTPGGEGDDPGQGQEPGVQEEPNQTAGEGADDEADTEGGNGDEQNETGDEGEQDAEDWADVDSISIDANEDGWGGRTPAFIEGETNPTLELHAGREYELTWVNNDGERHELEIMGDTGPVEGTESHEEQLEEHTLTFEATEDMVEYRCGIHQDTMVGDIEVHTE